MAEPNGHDALASPTEFAKFRIGGRDIEVGALTLWDLETSKDEILSLSGDTTVFTYAATCVRIIARKLKPEASDSYAEALLKSCSVSEARNIGASFTELWRISGFDVGEAEAAQEVSPGTGTSTESPPNSPLPFENQTSDASSVS
jgi:hypothetical protein